MSTNTDDVATASAEGEAEEGRGPPAAAAAVEKTEELPPAPPPPAATDVAKPPPAADVEAAEPSPTAPPNRVPPPSLRRKQLAEFNSWLYRWNNYQQHLASYWQGRYAALYRRGSTSGGVGVEGGERGGGGGGKRKKKARKLGGKSFGTRGDKVEEKWNLRFQELVDFKEEHGHTNVPKKFTYKYSPQPLGHWVGRMRHLHKKGTLGPDRVARLLSVDFEFVIAKSDKIQFSVVWYKSYQALVAFQEMNGHLEVPVGYKPQPDMAELDGWITRQRKHFRDDKLPDHLVAKLRGICRDFLVQSLKSNILVNQSMLSIAQILQ